MNVRSTPPPLADADSRDIAAHDLDRNLVVTAGAGTGKTSLLVERALVALASGRIQPLQLAAITFTEKAAGEMLERLAAGLQELRRLSHRPEGGDAGDPAHRAHDWLQRQGIPSATVSQRCLAALTLLDRLTFSTIHAFCAELLRSHPVEARVDPAFAVDTGDQFESLLRTEWDEFVRSELGPDGSRGALWERLLAAIPLSLVEQGARALAEFRVPFSPLEQPCGSELLDDLLAAVLPFVRRTREAFLARGRIGFDGLLLLTRDLLRDHPAIRERVKSRFRMLLVDEFQDTDPLQYEIVLFLAEAAGQAADDPYAARLAAGRLFIVGDPKQSIYRFRGADYGAFRRSVQRVLDEGGVELALTTNFRSRPGILQAVNHMFSTWEAWSESPEQPPYVPVTPARPAAPAEGVEVWSVRTRARLAAVARRAEGECVAREIHDMVTRRKEVSYGGITVLLRAFTSLNLYLRPLRQLGIPFIVDGGKHFLDRPEVLHLMAVLQALDRPGDEVALLAFLRSPLGAVSDVDLARYRAAGGRMAWTGSDTPQTDAVPAVARAFGLLRALRRATSPLPADAVIRHVLQHTDLAVLEAAAYEGPQRIANLRKLAELAGEMAREGRLSLAEVLDALHTEERPSEIEGDSPLTDEKTDAVRVLTIHKAKGLENDVVIVPDLGRKRPNFWQPVEVHIEGCSDGTDELALQLDSHKNEAHGRFSAAEKKHSDAEERRVLYVALTRAREKLILVSRPSTSDWSKALKTWGLDSAAPPEDRALLAGGSVLHRVLVPEAMTSREETTPVSRRLQAVRSREKVVRACLEGARPRFRHPSEAGDEPVRSAPGATGKVAATAVGRLVHALLEDWDGQKASLLQHLAPRARQVAEAGTSAEELAAEARDVLEAFLASPLAGRFQAADILAREMPLLLRGTDGQRWRGSIDLLYRAPDGGLVVADFKTDRESDPGVLAERHGGQLSVYVAAVARALGPAVPPRAELWMLRSGEVIAVDPAGPARRLMLGLSPR